MNPGFPSSTHGGAHPDIHFVPVPDRVLTEMLRMADVSEADVVYDLGCGDGRVVIAAAQRHGARGLGVDLDSRLLEKARRQAVTAGVLERVEFREGDLFHVDLRPATVLTLYLLDSLNVRLRPRIFSQCQPGTRVVTYSFEMGDWPWDFHTPMAANGVSLWLVPANLSGVWYSPGAAIAGGLRELNLSQRYQELAGTAAVEGARIGEVRDGRVKGDRFSLTIVGDDRPLHLSGKLEGDAIEGTLQLASGETCAWSASRAPGTMGPIEMGPEAHS